MSVQGILVASFGTTHTDTYEKNIKKLGDRIQESVPEALLVHAFTSSMVRKVLQKRNTPQRSPQEGLDYLLQSGVTDVTIQATHLLEGVEYGKLVSEIQPFITQFKSIKLGRPLLSSEHSLRVTMTIMAEKYPASDHPGVLLMGHGSDHQVNKVYTLFNKMAHEAGHTHLYMATVEAHPTLDEAEAYFSGLNITQLTLVPYMLVAGDHAKNDLLGPDPNSWSSILVEKGYQVTGINEGLGESWEIRELYLQHFRQAQELTAQ